MYSYVITMNFPALENESVIVHVATLSHASPCCFFSQSYERACGASLRMFWALNTTLLLLLLLLLLLFIS